MSHAQNDVQHDTAQAVRDQEALTESGRHRPRRLSPMATALTATIAAGSLALATYAATTSAVVPAEGESDAARVSEPVQAVVGQVSPVVAADTVAALSTAVTADASGVFGQARTLRAEQAADAMSVSTGILGESVDTLRQSSAAISERRAAERAEQAAAEQAAREAAERRAAEEAAQAQAAADQAAAEQAAAEQAAAAERAAEQQAAARSTETTSSRSAERPAPSQPAPSQPAPQPAPSEPAPQPAPSQPAPQPAPSNAGGNRGIAQGMLGSYGWGGDQWGCLDSLWAKESGWNHTATNPSSGAYGIPQSLPASKMASAGADWQTNPATQIRWGLTYIQGRYGTPCSAWAHSQAHNWY